MKPEIEGKTLEEIQKTCTHLGTNNPTTQNVLQTSTAVYIVISHNCAYCGKIFCVMNPLDIPSKIEKNTIIKP